MISVSSRLANRSRPIHSRAARYPRAPGSRAGCRAASPSGRRNCFVIASKDGPAIGLRRAGQTGGARNSDRAAPDLPADEKRQTGSCDRPETRPQHRHRACHAVVGTDHIGTGSPRQAFRSAARENRYSVGRATPRGWSIRRPMPQVPRTMRGSVSRPTGSPAAKIVASANPVHSRQRPSEQTIQPATLETVPPPSPSRSTLVPSCSVPAFDGLDRE